MHPDATAIGKRCSTCTHWHPIAEFSLKISATGQRQSRCRACQKIASRKHYEENREAVIARSATRNASQKDVLMVEVRLRLKGAVCGCGAKRKLTFRVNPGYQGPRVSAVVHNGMGVATLADAMANSTIVCPKCLWQSFVPALAEYNAERGTYQPKNISSNEYKRRHTRAVVDRRTSAGRAGAQDRVATLAAGT